jgi:hypothetical protein
MLCNMRYHEYDYLYCLVPKSLILKSGAFNLLLYLLLCLKYICCQWSLSICIQLLMQMEDCRTRYNGDADHHQRRKKFTFPARLICGDCFEVSSAITAGASANSLH